MKFHHIFILGWSVIALSLLVLIGWVFNIGALTSISEAYPRTVPMTALLISFLGISLTLKERKYIPICCVIVLLFTIWISLEYVYDKIPALENLIFGPLNKKHLALYPGRPSPRTLAALSLAAIALVLSSFSNKKLNTISIILSIAGLCIPWIALYGYLGIIIPFYSFAPSSGIGMSPITMAAFLMIFLAIIDSTSTMGVISILRTQSLGGKILRILLPFTILLPLAFSGFIGIHLHDNTPNIALKVISSFALLSALTTVVVTYTVKVIRIQEIKNEGLIKALTDSEKKYHQLVNQIEDYAIIRLDLNGKIDVWNKGAEAITGYQEKEIVGKSFSIFYPEDNKTKPQILLTEALAEGRSSDDGWRIKKNGEKYWVHTTIVPLYDADEILTGFVKVTQDLTEKKATEEKLATSEKRFRKLLNSTPDAMIISNADGIITYANNMSENTFGYNKEELINSPVEMLLPKPLRYNHQQHLKKYIKDPQIRNMGNGLPLKGVRKNQVEFPVEVSLAPIEDTDQTEVVAAIRDITERLKREEENREYLRNLELSQVIGKMGYYETDLEKDIMYLSENYMRLFGISKKEMPVSELVQYVHNDDVSKLIRKFEQAQRKDVSFTAEYRVYNPISKKVLYIKNSCYFQFKNNRAIKAIGLKQDVSQEKHNEKKINKLNDDLLKSNKELEAFSYSVSHDLRAPLRAITGFSNKLLRKEGHQLNDEGKRLLDIIIKNTTQMDNLINDILAFSRITRENIALSKINMHQLFSHIYNELKQIQKPTRNIEIFIDPLPEIIGDEVMLRQVISNLISNALKYTKTREYSIIEVGYNSIEAKNAFYVKDNGVGFDMRHKDKLFGVFQRLHSDSQFEGTGVGLAIAQLIINKHDGRIWGIGEPGKGATFYFTINT
ncbi:PAS domain-containing sensor histidine kinase [Fulvivirga ligni]|uniref:PAS domain-containing sensor histidine kinase n=1 Tax=Fulvivirga ligni TaxID=2904246 RepID=UPI001F31F6D4|nr:PAS domain-containing sensor histidine kinase [Fulvivirga ligni]UII24190.1 PAS domain S-box protein [Fulvivirga ligni]